MRNLQKQKGMRGQAIVGALIGLMVAIILLFAVVLPVTNDMLQSTDANLAGFSTAQTIANLFPLLLVVGGLILIVGVFLTGRR